MAMKFKEWLECFNKDCDELNEEEVNYEDIYDNKSSITLNLEPLPMVSPHWPGVGKYIGQVDDEKHLLFETSNFNKYEFWDTKTWQVNRVYQDELNDFNYHKYFYEPRNWKYQFASIKEI